MDRAKQKIEAYLKQYAEKDAAFAEKLQAEGKNIDDCIGFISSKVKEMAGSKSGGAMIDDDTVYGLAVHYYDEANLDWQKCSATIIYSGTITEEERAAMEQEAKAEAMRKLTEEQMAKLKAPAKPQAKAKEQPEENQLSLF